MLRDLIAWVLNNYLGKYVENLNTTQLTVALLSGEVELENLPLKKDALSHFGLPIKAYCGSIGKIKLQVPVRQFRTAPWCINIENVYIICGPVNLEEWDHHTEELSDLHYKQAFLDNLEAKWRTQCEDSSYYASSYSGWMNYGTSFITNIVENLQLKIKDVHIRYEDTITIPDRHFCCGLTIESLTAQSCDSNWAQGYTANWSQSQATFKLVELNSLSFYLDPLNADEIFSKLESNELAEAIEKFKAKTNHEFIIKPVSAQAKLKRDRSEVPLRTRNRPRLTCDLIWNEITLTLNENQYNSLVNCMRGLDDVAKYKKYKLLQPKVSIKENPRSWWRYAAQCHGFRHRDPLILAKNNLRYLKICKRLIANPNETLNLEEKEFKELIEKDRTLDDLQSLREICMILLPQTKEPKPDASNQGYYNQRSMLLHWFPQWWGWYGNATALNPSAISSNTPSLENQSSFEDEFLNALADTVETNSILKRDAVFGKFHFILKKGTLDVFSGGFNTETVQKVHIQFENLLMDVESRPRSGSHYVSLSLGSVLLKDHLTLNTEFPDIIKPQSKDELQQKVKIHRSRLSLNLTPPVQPEESNQEPLFQLEYEQKPFNYNTDYRLLIKSRSLDIVYNADVINWIIDFLSKPHLQGARRKLEAMKHKTKMELKRNWDQIIEGRLSERKTWTFEIDISAPQIIFVENLTDRQASSIVVIDFGRLQLTNGSQNQVKGTSKTANEDILNVEEVSLKDSEDDEMFLTPCSTPPDSDQASDDSPTMISALSNDFVSPTSIAPRASQPTVDGQELNEINLYKKLYDRYTINLTDLQILVCKGRERWNFASSKGTSNLHVLDRFNINLQLERRVIFTLDPQYPSLTLCGTLPKLNVHINESKIGSLTNMLNVIYSHNIESSFKSPSDSPVAENQTIEEVNYCQDKQDQASKLILLQFSIDQMSLEVQSSGRSVAELQVTGVKAGFTQRCDTTDITLSVHGLLLVDAMQSYGPDFELLVASHRHVGMDSLSGSLRQSEPCSPCSPGSPDPSANYRPTSPLSISRAISSLQRVNSPPLLWNAASDDIDALITIEITLIEPEEGGDKRHIANIQFNNLDIIANQETIVELLGFAQRVFPKKPTKVNASKNLFEDKNAPSLTSIEQKIRTEITFDFHRLNVLILRAVMRDNFLVARKVGTFTMSEARIHATIGKAIKVEGSLGGLQILDLTPEGINHQRILSVGNDPLTDPPAEPVDLMTSLANEVYGVKTEVQERQALSFQITRNLNACVDIKIRMGSVWFIHCARFMQEVSWCATEFKHYLKNLAKSIRDKAADMALGLVQPRPGDIARSSVDITNSPHHTRRHRTVSLSKPQENVSAPTAKVKILLDVVLNTPVLVMPRSSSSPHVLVAHLGKISISNCREDSSCDLLNDTFATINESNLHIDFNAQDYKSDENVFVLEDLDETVKGSIDSTEENFHCDVYSVDIRHMNLYSLDTTSRKGFRLSALPRAEEFYSCREDAVAILHDTAIRLEICRKLESSSYNFDSNSTSFVSISDGTDDKMDQLIVSGSIINPLRLTLKRQQYEQLLETIDSAFKVPTDIMRPQTDSTTRFPAIDENSESDLAETFTFDSNQKVKKVLFSQACLERRGQQEMLPKVTFTLPVFIIQLNNNENSPVVEICFRDFNVNYEKQNQWETNLQVSLRSVIMEDLLRPIDSKHRIMVSSADDELIRHQKSFLSNSCPNLAPLNDSSILQSSSLPDNLEPHVGFHRFLRRQKIVATEFLNPKSNCPDTPPPSPQTRASEDNLVIYSSLMVDPTCPQFESKYKSRNARSSIDFNCLSLNISVESWFVLLSFFGLLSDDNEQPANKPASTSSQVKEINQGKSELDISVKSLTLVLVKPDYELAKANVSNARFVVSKIDSGKTIEGSLGSISLSDLTTYGTIYREKFMTSGNEALKFVYTRENPKPTSGKRSLKKDAQLNIKMSSIRYVHTKRFVMEIQTFFKDFLQLQMPVIRKMKSSDPRQVDHYRPSQIGLEIFSESPLIILPMSSRSEKLIVANLGEFSLKNDFKWSNDRETISVRKDRYGPIELLDVMMIDLLHTDLYAGHRVLKTEANRMNAFSENPNCLDMGTCLLYKNGASLLKDKCHLKLQVERNLDSWRTHNVDDISVHGAISKLEAELDLEQYKLIRGFLSYNLGEEIDDVYESSILTNLYGSSISLNTSQATHENDLTWNVLSIVLDLQNVSVSLKQGFEMGSLACINFIKSTLKVDSKSDGSQDIDLISQEILITDTRAWDAEDEMRPASNVFTNILKPMNDQSGIIQAEIHSRMRQDNTQFTILLNNMRLMMILDWLELARDFILQIDELPAELSFNVNQKKEATVSINGKTFELKLNITDSELVFLENTERLDTNAVILKSTTVLNYRPHEICKSMSINLNNLEVFSCVLNAEDETALSIIDPVTINMEVRQGVLGVHIQKQFLIRLSYHDVKMFQSMLQSLPQQTMQARNRRSGSSVHIYESKCLRKLRLLGFKEDDCKLALEVSDNQLDEAALWLTQNAEPLKSPLHQVKTQDESPMNFDSVEVKANRISICVIDDCKDADVPLLEFSLNHLELTQDVNFKERSPMDFGSGNMREGRLKTILGSDYFNRALSGWEPIIEPWKCDATWKYSVAQLPNCQSRLNLKINSNEVLRLNITSTLMELYQIVRDNWTQDYYSANTSVVRRSPFIPFAIKNETDVRLHFTTFVAAPGTSFSRSDVLSKSSKEWHAVEPGEVVTFSFTQTQSKQRHIDSHKLNLHQIAVRVEGWAEVGPVSVDRVGVFFRHAGSEIVDPYSAMPKARIVFGVTLEGSAQKLITVRSALKFINKLDHPVLMKMEHLFGHLNIRSWPPAKTVIISANESYSVPITHVHAFLYVKPLPINFRLEEIAAGSSASSNQIEKIDGNAYWNRFGKLCDGGTIGNFQFTEKSIHWKDVQDPLEVHQEIRKCCSITNKLYKLVFAIKKEPYPSKDNMLLPGHSITLWPPLRLHNLLPCDLLYKLPTGSQGRIPSSNTANIHEVDLEQPLEVTIALDSFSGSGSIFMQAATSGSGEAVVKLTDLNGRILLLTAFIQVIKGNGMQISVTAPFWLVNRTGLPLIFRQEGVSNEFAGQFSENEQARLISPLMFSFSDPDSSIALTIRLGKRYGSNLPWCQPFNLHKDVLHRQLKSNSTNETFIIGIEVRRGRGRYSQTSIVTFSPRFQLYNRSSYKLQFAQKCFATILTDLTAQSTFIEAIPGCHLPFHWPRLDKEQELCVRIPEVEECLWSSGIPIQETQSLYINVRDINGNMHFLRLEIILQGATYYMLFGNAEVLPPPIRIDNYSEVAIKFYQTSCRNLIKTSVKPHSSIAFVLDETNGSQSICVEAPGGDVCKCPLYGFESSRLTYENFIYIAFTQTFENVSNYSPDFDEFDVKAQQLVLGVVGNRVILVKKQAGDRSQLWRMNNDKQLEHEGSSPPSEPGKKAQRFVLDLEKPPQPLQQMQLVVRPANNQRKLTQTWYFTEDGRLMCEHTSMCVQPRNGFFGLRNGTDAVLGLIVRDTKAINNIGVPFEQAIERQKLRPGSGCLSVKFRMDGPIKTIQIKDVKFQSDQTLAVDPCWRHVSHILPNSGNYFATSNGNDKTTDKSIDEYHINLNLVKGIGLSLVSRRPCEEMAYISFEEIHTEIINTPVIKSLDLSVRDLQIDNQLFETSCPIFMYTIKNSSDDLPVDRLPALQLNAKVLSSPNKNAVIFEHLILSLRPLSVYMEERLLLRLAEFFGLGTSAPDPSALPDESDYEAQRIVSKILAANAKRYYFGDLSIVPSQIRLSVLTASKLPPNLGEIKKCLGLTLIKFEDAVINFEKFCDRHHFETLELYWAAIKSHYKQELKWQAASILGSVDFLGNPLGFANDLSEGVSSLLKEGNVKSLVKNVTHGISNSTAKLTETLSDGLGRVVLDDQYTEARQRILEVNATAGGNSTGDHLVAGLKGFGYGLLGGMTSIVKHTYNGAQSDGIQGFLSGLGKGLVGTVAKPVIGVLDLASETANAVRETSKSSNRILPDRKRLPRCVTGAPGGLLPIYSTLQSKGQQHLFMINKRDFNEKFMAYEPCLLESKDSKLRLLVSTENIWVFSKSDENTTVIFCYNLSELITCTHVEVPAERSSSSKVKKLHYIELCLSLPSKTSLTPSAPEMVKRPRVKCQNEEIAKKAERHINYAKSVHIERDHAINDSVI